jgi:hypothetical protein
VKLTALAVDADKRDKLSYEWHLGDGTMLRTGARTVKRYGSPGAYEVFAIVSDGRGGVVNTPTQQVFVVASGVPYFDVTRVRVVVNFAKTNRETISISGQLPVPDGTSLDGLPFDLAFGPITRSLTLDARGRASDIDVRVTVLPPKRSVAKFSAKLTGDFRGLLETLGMQNEALRNVDVTTPITITFNGVTFSENFVLVYAAKAGRIGTAK